MKKVKAVYSANYGFLLKRIERSVQLLKNAVFTRNNRKTKVLLELKPTERAGKKQDAVGGQQTKKEERAFAHSS